ncbi:myelin expression factor 2 isoform X3 [Ciona intestinalis]
MADFKMKQDNKRVGSRSPSPRAARDRVERISLKKERPAPYHRNGRDHPPGGRARNPPFPRVFVNNIPYEEKWQAIKDLFRSKVGEVTYVELFMQDKGKSRGYGVIEFKDKETCHKAVELMNRYEINNRKIVVREDFHGDLVRKNLERDGHPRPHDMRGPPPMHNMPPPMGGHQGPMPPMPPPMNDMNRGPMGMNKPMPDMGRPGPMGKTVFVANLDYKVTYSKVKEVFQLAGKVVKVELMLDKDNKSRGMATVTYEEPMEAAQAISMLNNQRLYDRIMIVKMDKDNSKEKKLELPSGLAGIGPGISRNPPRPDMGVGGMGDGMMNKFPPSMMSNPAPVPSMGGGLPGLAGLGLPGSLAAVTDLMKAGGLGLGGLASLAGINDITKHLGLRDPMDQRMLQDQRSRLLAATRGFSERDRIEMDIASVDNRIRDLDRSLAERSSSLNSTNLPQSKQTAMPPPMRNGNRVPGTTVFVRNLPYSLTWQKLRDKFTRCGHVLFAEIKMDNGKSRGFGNVRFETVEQAQAAVRYFNGAEIEGRNIDVHVDSRG